MKKLMALSLALLMTLSLVACGSKTEQPSTGSNSSDAEATGFVPSKNVTWICTSSAGGGSDVMGGFVTGISTSSARMSKSSFSFCFSCVFYF